MKSIAAFLMAALLLMFSQQLFAEVAPAQQGVQKFIETLRGMKFPPADEARQSQLVATANALLDLESMSKKALGENWAKASEEQRKLFLDLMSQLVEKVAYPKSSHFMGDYEIQYPEVAVDGNGFAVHSVIKQEEEGLDAEVIYHLYDKTGTWVIDDVFLDGVSITEDLRYQFDKLIQDSRFEGLLEKMKSRLAEAATENQNAAA